MAHNFIWATTREEWDSMSPNEQWEHYQKAFTQMGQWSKWYIESLPKVVRSKPTWIDRLFGRQFHVEIIAPKKRTVKAVW